MSDIDTAAADSLKVLDPERPIREADMTGLAAGTTGSRMTHSAIPAPSMPHCKILTRDHKLGPQSYSVWDI